MAISREMLRHIRTFGFKPDGSFTEAEIKSRYSELVKSWHSDLYQHDPEMVKEATAYLQDLQNSKDALLNWLKSGKPGLGAQQGAQQSSRPNQDQKRQEEDKKQREQDRRSARPDPPPGASQAPFASDKSAGQRVFQKELGKWPEIYVLPSGDGYELRALHVSPDTFHAALTGSRLTVIFLFFLLFNFYGHQFLFSLIVSILSMFIVIPLLRIFFRINSFFKPVKI